jgi:predicted DNA-binding transcriptional regulator AlpA
MVHRTKTAQRLRARLGSEISASETDDAQLLTSKQVRALLGNCSEMHIWRLLHVERYQWLNFPRSIPIGRRNYFRRRDIVCWIDRQAAASVHANTAEAITAPSP